MPDYSGMTVREILRLKKGRILKAPLPRGAPSWTAILGLTWEVICERARQRKMGYGTFRKLLMQQRFDKSAE